MKVSLLKSPVGGIIGLEMITFVEPLGLECVAGCLKRDGHQCQIVDLRVDGMPRGMKKAQGFEPHMRSFPRLELDRCQLLDELFNLFGLNFERPVKPAASAVPLTVGCPAPFVANTTVR